MNQSLFDRLKGYLLAAGTVSEAEPPRQRPAVTISRETGAGAVTIGQLLADYLQKNREDPNLPWAVLDRNLTDKILEEHKLPKSVGPFMQEDSTLSVRDALEELLGLHPSSWTLLEHTSQTILKLALRGNVVIVGRGANIITAHLKHVVHVRLVAPLEQRITHVENYYHLDRDAAVEFVAKTDRARSRYVMQNFRSQIDDPLAYHLTINTGRLAFNDAARLIGEAVMCREHRSSEAT